MPETDLEIAVLSRFIRAAKRDRCVGFVSKPKTRARVFDELRNPAVFDPACVTTFTGADRTAEKLLVEYRRHGMGSEVYLMSPSHRLDGARMPLDEALRLSFAACVDVLGYCPASATAFYEWHHSGASWFLSR
jgi:hypothetical protein